MDKQEEVERLQFEKKMIERRMDQEFERRLKSMDLEEEEVQEPEKKKQTK